MKLTDGTYTVEIKMFELRNGSWGPDLSNAFFLAGSLPFADEELGIFKVDDVSVCFENARDWENEDVENRWVRKRDELPKTCIFYRGENNKTEEDPHENDVFYAVNFADDIPEDYEGTFYGPGSYDYAEALKIASEMRRGEEDRPVKIFTLDPKIHGRVLAEEVIFETTDDSIRNISEKEAYDLLLNANALFQNNKLLLPTDTDPETIKKIKENKPDLLYYCSGQYFNQMLYMRLDFCNWVVLKCSNTGDVWYPPKTMFKGTAHEVDLWCKQHADDPLFTNEYTSKYSVCWEKQNPIAKHKRTESPCV